MLPLMNRKLFKIYLKLIAKLTKWLDALNYVTKCYLLKYLWKYSKLLT